VGLIPRVVKDEVEHAFVRAIERMRSNSVESKMRWSEGATMIPISEGSISEGTRLAITAFAYAIHGAVFRIWGSHRMFKVGIKGR
jgi:hypothetical protein